MFKLKYRFYEGEGGGEGNGGGGGESSGDGATSWTDSLPESIRDWDEVKNSDSPEKFYEQMTNMRSRMGRSITIPGEDAGEEATKAFQEKLKDKVPGLIPTPNIDTEEGLRNHLQFLGMPEKSDGYENIEGIPEEDIGSLKEMAHTLGLTRAQYKMMATNYLNDAKTIKDDSDLSMNEGLKDLKSEWGLAYDERVQKADKIRQAFFPQIDKMNHQTIKSLYEIAQQMGTEFSDISGQGKETNIMTPEDAKMQISEIRNNKDHPFHNVHDLAHAEARRKMSSLYELAYPGNSNTIGA